MKKVFFAATLLTGAALLSATDASAQGIRFGVKAGANYSNLAGDLTDEDRYESKFGAHGGLMMNIGLLDDGFLSLQPELLYSQKGFKYADTNFTILGTNYKWTGKVNYHYLDVPVLLRINANGPFFEAGPQFGYLLSVSDDVTYSVNGQPQSSSTDYKKLDNVNRTEIGYAAGFGYQADSGPLIGLRYNGGLTTVPDKNSGNTVSVRNSVFQLFVGYVFGAN